MVSIAYQYPGGVPSSRIEPWQRFRRSFRCPICGGAGDDAHGDCWGYISADEQYAHCTRHEHAGALTLGKDSAYAHKLHGPCRCGIEHGAANDAPRPIRPADADKERKRWTCDELPATWKDKAGNVYKRTKVWPYKDADGALRFVVIRYERPDPAGGKPLKTFRQAQPLTDGNGWAMDLDGVERVPYRLPELLSADPARPVFICEGEKAADAVAALGLVSTTASEGARKWGAEHSAWLRDRHAVILPDHDTSGEQDKALKVAALHGVAASVRVLELPNLPPKGDVVDWLADGGTAVQLLELVAVAPLYQPPQDAEDVPRGDDLALQRERDAHKRTQDTLRISEQHCRNLEQELAALRRWMEVPAEKMSAPLKLAAVEVRHHLQRHKQRGDDGRVRVFRAAIAERLGVSEQTAGGYLRDLGKLGVLDHATVKHFDDSEIRIGEGPLFNQPEAITPTARPNSWGGKRRKTCKECGSEHLVIKRRIVCEDCGSVEDLTDLRVNSESSGEANEQEPPAQYSCPAKQDGLGVDETPEDVAMTAREGKMDAPTSFSPEVMNLDADADADVVKASNDPPCDKPEHAQWWHEDPDGSRWCSAWECSQGGQAVAS